MISDLLREFAFKYGELRTTPFRHDSITRIVTHDVVEDLYELLDLERNTYLIKGSVGQGSWADIPWVAVMHKGITASTQDGYYIAVLFTRDLSGVYISLGLGWTQFSEKYGNKNGKLMVREYADKLNSHLLTLDRESKGVIHLGATTSRSKGYELANLVSAYLSINQLTDTELKNTLVRYLKYYEMLRDDYGADLFYASEIPPNAQQEVADIQDRVRKFSTVVNKQEALIQLKSLTDTLPPVRRKVFTTQIIRNRAFANFVKTRANYTCEICGRRPFIKKNGQPYAEADHVDPLFTSGVDHPDNMRCLCALCHRIVTYGSQEEVDNLITATVALAA